MVGHIFVSPYTHRLQFLGYAKTFGRKIKLVMSSSILSGYLSDKHPNEPFFIRDWRSFCMYIKRVFVRVLGDVATKGGKSIREIRPYDFRHSAACYWRTRYKSVNAYKRYLSSEQYCRTHADDLSQPIWFEKIQKKLEEQDGMRQ